MRFVDEAYISVKAGKGGPGCVSFRREKFIPRGGPNGGDGGNGGSVILKVSHRLLSLYDFRLKRRYEAENGRPGQGSQMYGRNGEDIVLELPLGTLVFEVLPEGGERLVADLSTLDCEVVIAEGGIGGKGNEHFKSATMQAPRFAQPGTIGQDRALRLELKILADAGLLGLPNAGKSTFISKVSAARPKIAPYPFTTLVPNLGVMIDDDNDRRMVIADIPGLVEGAHSGHGLGHRFLKHVERTRFLIHILSAEDASPDSPFAGFELINDELALFDPRLKERKQLEVINKIDLLEPDALQNLKAKAKEEGRTVYFISALTGEGIENLQEAMWELNDSLPMGAPNIDEKSADDIRLDGGSEDGMTGAGAAGEDIDDTGYTGHADDDDYSGIEVIWTKE